MVGSLQRQTFIGDCIFIKKIYYNRYMYFYFCVYNKSFIAELFL